VSEPGSLREEPGTCWRSSSAERLSWIVDGQDYFRHVAESLEAARHQVIILGWDVHSRARLRPSSQDESGEGRGEDELGPFLDRLARGHRRLRVFLLSWDYAFFYAIERELLPGYRLGRKTHRRVRFELDGEHPLGASQHQKIVVVDDRVAFLGGLDLTIRRWDTRKHRVEDSRRVDPAGRPYNPFHDVQVAVSGEAARALGDLARKRWRRATGKRLEPPGRPKARDPWPRDLRPDLRDVEVGLSRTRPAHDGRRPIREIQRLYEVALASARRSVYIENQYLSSQAIGDALCRCLEREEGPEVLLVVTRRCTGWLEEATVGTLRELLLARLRRADQGGRLRVYYPHRKGLGEAFIKVHSKVCVVDDAFVTVGSANLSNRSMGLDTECNLFLEARGTGDERAAIAALRDGLIAEHLDVDPGRVREEEERRGSLAEAVDALRGGERTLEPLPEDAGAAGSEPMIALADPETPLQVGDLGGKVVRSLTARPRSWAPALWLLAMVAFLTGLALAWRTGPLAEWLPPERIGAWIETLRESPAAPLATLGIFLVAGVLMFPVSILILQTALVHPPLPAMAHALLGSLASAALGFGLGRLLGRRALRGLLGRHGGRLTRVLAQQGAFPVAAIRLIPLAPFTMVNLAAGAVGMRFGSYLLGTLLGMGPGIVLLSLVGHGLVRLLSGPSWEGLLVLVAGTALALVGLRRLATLIVGGNRAGNESDPPQRGS
jgi:phosphatidylserine/phosphatidylglycerophosphate/cardiolipin synthase-like enzyme/uncharacterized membrane protein YdjX (TVP38/TMEM64 family)